MSTLLLAAFSFLPVKVTFTDNIRMDREEIGINAGNWVDSAQDMYY